MQDSDDYFRLFVVRTKKWARREIREKKGSRAHECSRNFLSFDDNLISNISRPNLANTPGDEGVLGHWLAWGPGKKT